MWYVAKNERFWHYPTLATEIGNHYYYIFQLLGVEYDCFIRVFSLNTINNLVASYGSKAFSRNYMPICK